MYYNMTPGIYIIISKNINKIIVIEWEVKKIYYGNHLIKIYKFLLILFQVPKKLNIVGTLAYHLKKNQVLLKITRRKYNIR